MRGVSLLCFLFILPALLVLGHDLYLAFGEEGTFLPVKLSDAGWLWTTYAPDLYDRARESLDPGFWTRWVEPILRQKALAVAAVPALCLYALLFALKLFGRGPFSGAGLLSLPRSRRKTRKSLFAYKGLDKEKPAIKYRRR